MFKVKLLEGYGAGLACIFSGYSISVPSLLYIIVGENKFIYPQICPLVIYFWAVR
jgi:hypothetical protein